MKEVYQEDKIKEWDPVDPSNLEHFLIIVSGKEGHGSLNTHFRDLEFAQYLSYFQGI